jgi:hypothetical protein
VSWWRTASGGRQVGLELESGQKGRGWAAREEK